jgi:hypothetical protein
VSRRKAKGGRDSGNFDSVTEEKRKEKWSSVKRAGLDEMSTGKG